MSTRRPTSSSTLPKLLIAILVVAVLGIAGYAVASSQGWFDSQVADAKPSREGMIAIPRSLAPLKAFEQVRRDAVFDRELGDESYFWLPKATVERNPGWVTSVDQIINRVMARDKGADYVFKKSDFLPVGSSTGIAGGVPAGKQGFFLEVDEIPGLRFLKQGDHFDLLASLPKESEESTSEYGLLMGGIKARGDKVIPVNGVRLLVKGGQMIALTTDRQMTTQGGLELDADKRNRTEKVAIAIDPEEAVPLTQALGEKLQIHMTANSGQDNDASLLEDQLVGRIPFPANALEIEAFSAIKASDLAEPVGGELRQYYFQPGDANDGWISQASDLIGRVVARDIEPGYIFSESDFLPEGSLLKSVEAFQTISREDLVGAGAAEFVGSVAARDLIAGHQITPGDLLPENGVLRDVEPYHQLGAEDLVQGLQSPFMGRITAYQLKAGRELDESLLFPVGSRPGISAGIPAGRVAVSVKTDAVRGLNDLVMSDRIDLIESSSVDLQKSLSGVEISAALLTGNQQDFNQVIVSNARVVRKLEDQVVLAVRVDEVSGLVKSLARQGQMIAVARPDRVGVEMDVELPGDEIEIQSDVNPLQKITVTKLIMGGKKSAKAFRRGNDE